MSCKKCRHFEKVIFSEAEEMTGVCRAYPEGIPAVLFSGEKEHQLPFLGDRGYRYVPKQGWA